jgi:hypothetical protein
MATIINEIARDQDGQFRAGGWELTRIWNVQVDSVVYASIAAVEAVRTQEADISDAHPQNPFAFLQTLTPVATENRKIWNVTGAYKQGTLPTGPQDPLDQPKEVAWSSSAYTRPVVKDNDGNAIVNSAGESFDPPLTEDGHNVVGTITYNSDQYDPQLGATFEDAVNKDTEKIANLTAEPRTAKIIEVGATQEFFSGTPYWVVTVKVEINLNTWDREVLDQGLHELAPISLELVRMETDDGADATEPLLLNGGGERLLPGEDPEFLTFRTLEEKDFAPLNLEIREET